MKIELKNVNFKVKGLNIFGIIITTKKQLEEIQDFSAEEVNINTEDKQ